MVQKRRSLTRAVYLGLSWGLAVLLSGCPSPWTRPEPPSNPTTPAPPPSSPVPPPPAPAPAPRPQAPPRENRLSPATRSLVTQARALLAHGDIDGASATLDRALRIEPSNPLLWIELGKVRLVDGNAHQAEVCARKALALASGDHAAQAQAGRVLADALRAQGRNQDAQEVESRPYMH
jgi:Tetratricopeptide repeat